MCPDARQLSEFKSFIKNDIFCIYKDNEMKTHKTCYSINNSESRFFKNAKKNYKGKYE